MNREIKLRAYNFQDECFDYYDLNTAKGQGRLYNDYEKADIGEDGEIYCGTHSDLHLFTGLKDKNGVEIYEGDIVHIYAENMVVRIGKFNDSKNEIFQGVFVDNCQKSPYDYRRGLEVCDLQKCKVIGNTYENPELLEENRE